MLKPPSRSIKRDNAGLGCDRCRVNMRLLAKFHATESAGASVLTLPILPMTRCLLTNR
jgi:hypothetical protein